MPLFYALNHPAGSFKTMDGQPAQSGHNEMGHDGGHEMGHDGGHDGGHEMGHDDGHGEGHNMGHDGGLGEGPDMGHNANDMEHQKGMINQGNGKSSAINNSVGSGKDDEGFASISKQRLVEMESAELLVASLSTLCRCDWDSTPDVSAALRQQKRQQKTLNGLQQHQQEEQKLNTTDMSQTEKCLLDCFQLVHRTTEDLSVKEDTEKTENKEDKEGQEDKHFNTSSTLPTSSSQYISTSTTRTSQYSTSVRYRQRFSPLHTTIDATSPTRPRQGDHDRAPFPTRGRSLPLEEGYRPRSNVKIEQ